MSCSVDKCKNVKRFKPEGVTFHRFPKGDLLKKWLEALGMSGEWQWSGNKFVCSEHFEKYDFTMGERRHLKSGAIPSVGLEISCGIVATTSRSSNIIHSKENTILTKQAVTVEEQHSQTLQSSLLWTKLKRHVGDDTGSPNIKIETAGACSSNGFEEDQTINCADNRIAFKQEEDNTSSEEIYLPSNSSPSEEDINLPSNSWSSEEELDNIVPSQGKIKDGILPVEVHMSNTPVSSDNDLDNCMPLQRKRRYFEPRYFGDCQLSHMYDPTLAKRSWEIASSTINVQKKKIGKLQHDVRRHKTKINTLKSLVKYLKDNNLVTDAGLSVIRGQVLRDKTWSEYVRLSSDTASLLQFICGINSRTIYSAFRNVQDPLDQIACHL